MMLRRFQPKTVPAPQGAFSPVVMDDRYAFLSGLVAADFPEGRAVLGDVGAETRAVLTAIRGILEEIDLAIDRIVRVDVHLSDLNDFDAMDGAYREFFDAEHQPARTTTESKRLIGNSRVEITCQARL